MNRIVAIAFLVVVAASPGCSNLVVKKVPLRDRYCGDDNQQGFRYYLNRPYLLVKDPILLYEKKSLVDMDDPKLRSFLRSRPPSDTKRVPVDELMEMRKRIVAVAPGAGFETLGTPMAPAGASAAAAEGTDSLEMPKIDKLPDDTTLEGNIQIVYLPDLDEQYVVKSKNWLAKSAFSLSFKNGSELVEVNGEHDSTTLALALFEQVQEAIGVAQQVAQEEIKRAATAGDQGEGAGGTRLAVKDAEQRVGAPVYQMIEKVYIKAGVYRLNKPWEMEDSGNGAIAPGCGLLVKLGLPTSTDIRFERIGSLQGGEAAKR